jgi:L-ribulose-5-phosphate 4-epimerase
MSAFQNLKEACCDANRRLPGLGLVDLTFGNVSMVDRGTGCFAIKPSGVAYELLKPDDMVVLDFDGCVLEGTLRPSSDMPTHRRLILAFPFAGAIVHTHSRNATAFAQAGRPIPCLGTTHADYFFGEVPVTRPLVAKEIQGDYEWETGNVIVERFQAGQMDSAYIPAVLVHGHAPFTWGIDAEKALENSFALETIAEMARKTLQINPEAVSLSEDLIKKHFMRKHGPAAYYGQSRLPVAQIG